MTLIDRRPSAAADACASERIGFIGLGRMGYPMARNLAVAGFDLTAFDLRPQVTEEFCRAHGAKLASGLGDLASASIVITMLPTSKDVRDILLGTGPQQGLASLLSASSMVIDCSSSDPLDTRQLGSELAARGIRMVDAPVAGGVVFAEDGSLDVLVGGEPEDISRAEPVLLALGKNLHRCGQLGAAHAMKLLNNFVNAQALVTYIEAVTVGAKFGIDLEVMVRSLESATTGRNHPFEKKFLKHIVSGKFSSGMALQLISKDVSLAHRLASALGAWAPIMSGTSEIWAEAVRELGGNSDQTEVSKLWEGKAGIQLRAQASS